jgi:hypothetical protein
MGEQRWNAIGRVEGVVLLLVTHVYQEKEMTKKSSVSSQPGELVRVSGDSILKAPLSKQQKAVFKEFAAKQAAEDDSGIDYSDIPPLTDEQMATAVRGWRHFRRPILLERSVLDKLTEIAERKGVDLDALVNDILKKEIAIAEALR